LALLAMAAMAVPASADEEKSIHWLMREPVTLFDLGIIRLRLDVAAVSDRFHRDGLSADRPISGAYYLWPDQRIIVYMTVRELTAAPSALNCRETFAYTQDRLLHSPLSGPRRAETYLEGLFLHEGPGNRGRPPALGEDLVEAVRLEITLLPPAPSSAGGSAAIRCAGRLDTDPAAATLSTIP
jgi:hypothetical protein